MTDAASFAAALDRALLTRGVAAGTSRALAFAQGVAAIGHPNAADVYWTARIAMLPRIEDLAAFDAAFVATLFELDPAQPLRAALRRAAQPRSERPARTVVAPASTEIADEAEARNAPFVAVMASPQELLAERDFATFGEHERDELFALIARLRVGVETRPSRRRKPAQHGERFDLRGTMRGAARTAGELLRSRKVQRRRRVRPLVFLCDVSGSMAPYARALLLYARANALARPRVRTFAFATRLTDLGARWADTSARWVPALQRTLRDYGGGTRIGASLRAFNERYAQRGAARGGTVVILSDGWERDEPDAVRMEMQRLRRLTRRIVWVNPQKKHPAFEPLTRGMAAALPFVDAFVAGHNLRTLNDVADAIDGGMNQR